MHNHCFRRRLSRTASVLVNAAGLIVLLPTLSRPVRAQSLDGFWQSDGYGLLVEIQGPRMTTFQTTSISCVRWWTARRSDRSDTSSEAVFKRGDADIRLTLGSSSDALLMREGPSISYVSLRRASGQPKTCSETLEDTPLNNYAVFWQTFAEQFALFPVYRIDWVAIDRKFRPKVTPSTSPEELFGILRAMILPFHNAHTNINAASIGRQYLGYRPVSEIGRRLQSTSSLSIEDILALFSQEARRSKAIIESRYSVGPLRQYANEMIDFGMLKDSIGYLRILAFEGYTKDGSFEQGAAALQEALDEVFTGAERMKGLIIDVRVNTGGADPLALAIASRLAGAKYLAYSKVTRNNLSGPLHFTSPQPAWVDVSTRPGYRGSVVLLIGPETISGGETFAMALMGRTPRVTFVGENTQGVFSDVWGRKLPSGWTFGVPTELYLTSSGKSFDGQGVPPDIRVSVFPKADLEAGRDGPLERAIRVILARYPVRRP
jgi:Peptidase family S41